MISKPKGKTSGRLEDNIKADLQETGLKAWAIYKIRLV
jgi:hypothetical protein